jgi:uroporphyrin-III C-methyltransferase/precorrin-2 dehydrogenase/sirohydrochlorin ferrochelatase
VTSLIGLDLVGRSVLVVGGGPVSARRALALAADGADVLVVAPALCEDLADLVAAGGARWRRREVSERDLDGMWLVHVATGDRGTDDEVARWAQELRVWCVHAGSADSGTARVPATAEVGDVRVAVLSTGRPDPRRAARVRDQLRRHLQDGSVDLRAGRPGAGRVILVGGGPGADDLITVRGMMALHSADVVVTDRLGPTGLLADLPPDVAVIDVGKSPGHHPVPQHEINAILVEQAQAGHTVVRLKGGDPFVLGRGGEEMLACHEAGVPVEVVPGVSSAVAVPAAAGIPVTHRGLATSFHVITGHEGLTPAVADGLRAGSVTVVVLMGVAMLGQLVPAALAAGVDPATPFAAVQHGWTPQQRVCRTTLAEAPTALAACGIEAPAVMVIGAVAALQLEGTASP